MRYKVLRRNLGRLWLMACLLPLLLSLTSCSSLKKNIVYLPESKAYYLIPAGTPFQAIVKDGGELETVVRDKDTWAVDAGYFSTHYKKEDCFEK